MNNPDLQFRLLEHMIRLSPGITLIEAIDRLSEIHKTLEGKK